MALCAQVCGRVIMVTSRGLIRSHGPKGNRCQGSSLPPSRAGPSVPSHQAQPVSHSVSQPSSSVPSGLSPRSSPVTELCSLPSGRRIVRRIPKGSRGVALAKLSTILEQVVSQNSVASWQRLLEFPSRCLGAPTRGGRSRSLVSFLNRQIEDESGLQGCPPSSLRHSPRTTSDALRI